ncbi:MAG: hypothetical protein HY754_13195 [Nitrospirae bacterium]|nr:hypothetical protein [Nitrospirota bacterium]
MGLSKSFIIQSVKKNNFRLTEHATIQRLERNTHADKSVQGNMKMSFQFVLFVIPACLESFFTIPNKLEGCWTSQHDKEGYFKKKIKEVTNA